MSKILRLAVVTLLLSAFGTPSVAAFSGGVTPMCPQGNGKCYPTTTTTTTTQPS